MTNTMPVFKFVDNITDAEIEAAINEVNKPKFLEPGAYDLKITNAEVVGTSKSDPSWINVQLELSAADGRNLRHYLLIPTTSFRFKAANGKETMFLFTKTREFLAALGEETTVDKIKNLIPKLFGNPASLIGRSVSVDVGYDGYHILRLADKTFKLLDKKGKDVNELTFPDRESATAAAAELGIEIKRYANVLKFHQADTEEDTDSDEWN